MQQRAALVLALLALFAGCISSGAEVCSNGLVCPKGSPCVEVDGDIACAAVCGDGVLGAGEDCEPGIATGQICTSIGHYGEAAVACTAGCAFDTSECSGFCGDEIVNGDEVCDGEEALTIVGCLSVGDDYGRLGCSGLCSLEPSGCRKIGWVEDPQVAGSLNAVWAAAEDDYWAVGEEGLIVRFDGFSWWSTPAESPAEVSLRAIWGAGAADIWAVGFEGTILHYDGSSWSDVATGIETSEGLRGVWAGGDDVWVVGFSATVLHFDGSTWSQISDGPSGNLYGIWGQAEDDVWAVGSDGVWHFDGSSWTQLSTVTNIGSVWGPGDGTVWVARRSSPSVYRCDRQQCDPPIVVAPFGSLNRLWGSADDDVWAVGDDGNAGLVAHYDGTSWTAISPALGSSITPDQLKLRGVFGTSGSDAWIVAEAGFETGAGTTFHYEGAFWSSRSHDLTEGFTGVWGSSPDNVWAVGLAGTGGARRYNGSDWEAPISLGAPAYGIWGANESEIWAVGAAGAIWHYDGTWGVPEYVDATSLSAVWGSSASDVWAGGGDALTTRIFHYDGVTWEQSPIAPTDRGSVPGIWGTAPDAVWFATTDGVLLHFDGTSFSVALEIQEPLTALWGTSPTDIWVVGSGGSAFHYDGDEWQPSVLPTTRNMTTVVGLESGDVFAAGASGSLVHFTGDAWRPVRTPPAGVQHFSALWASGPYLFYAASRSFGWLYRHPSFDAP